jgi:DNA polymerase-3 subunit epsilon
MKWPSRTGTVMPFDADLGWRRAQFLVVDVETTGLNLRHDEIVSIGSTEIVNGRVSCRLDSYTVVRPTRQPCVEAIQIHGLRPADVIRGVDPREVAQTVHAGLAGSILVAHAAWIERAFVGRLLRSAGLTLTAPSIDTAALARAVGLGPADGRYEPSLEHLATRLGLPVYTPHHALGDALTTAVVFLALVARCEAAAGSDPLTVGQLLFLSDRHCR